MQEAGKGASAPPRSKPLLHFKDLGLVTQNRKIRFTCVHASENFLACGASNGSVYLYATSVLSRSDSDSRVFPTKYHLVKMITPPSNDRVAVTCLSICPQQKRLVVGTMRGVVYGIQLSDYNKIGEKVEFSHDFHSGFPITCFLWDKRGQRLFSACNGGSVCQTVLRAGVSAIFGSVDTELLLKEETGIVQLDLAKYGRAYILLVSSQLRVLLLNLTSGDGSAVQIGTKARQGSFGACFFTSLNADSIDPAKKRETKVFSSRPGRRVWVADPQTGTVSSTLKFALGKNPTSFLQATGCGANEAIQNRDLSINKLRQFQFIQEPAYAPKEVKEANVLLVSWNIGSSVIFFLDPNAVEIVEWHIDLGVVTDLKVINDTTLVVLHGEPPKVSMVRSCSPQEWVDIYGGSDTRKKIELAINFTLNDAVVLRALQQEWQAYLESVVKAADNVNDLTSSLKTLLASAQTLEKEYQDAAANELPGMDLGNSRQMQVIFKQRPQTATVTAEPSTPDLFASTKAHIHGDSPSRQEKQVVTLGTGNALHKPIEYFDVLASSEETYTKSISAPDGSTLEARLIDIPELARAEPVLPIDLRQHYMEDIMTEVKEFERLRAEDGTMNNFLPALRGSSSVAAKAFSTLIPTAGVFSNLMDPSVIAQPFQLSASGLFGSLSDMDDDLVLDPDPRLYQKAYTHGQLLSRGPGEYSVLRIAMSTADSEEDKLDSEVLLEAISMDIWDTNLKYVSNLPISEQLDLPPVKESRHALRTTKRPIASVPDATRGTSNGVSRPAPAPKATDLFVHTDPPTVQDEASAPKKQRLQQRPSLSPDAGRSALRALQKHLGAMPSCEVKRRCIVGGWISSSPELEPVMTREVSELMSELVAASETAEKTKQLSKRLWPASGITRVCACLANVFLLQGDLARTQSTIEAWLGCFDPTAQNQDPVDLDEPVQGDNSPKTDDSSGFARGEALVDGDGLPLTRNDWNLVRTLVSTYFAISAAGSRLCVRPLGVDETPRDRIYEQQMGVTVGLDSSNPAYRRGSSVAANDKASTNLKLWSAQEAEAFVNKYGVYLTPDLAAEACNLAGFSDALTLVLDRMVSSSDMSEICDDIKTSVAENDFNRALATLNERDSFCLLLHLLDLLMKKCPQEAIEICIDRYPILLPENVERSLFGKDIVWGDMAEGSNSEILASEVVAQTARYFRYMVRLLEVHTEIAGRDAQLVERCLGLCFAGLKVTGNLFELDDRGGLATWVASLVAQPDKFVYDHEWCWKLLASNEVLPGMLELMMLSLKTEEDFERGLKELHETVATILQKEDYDRFEPLFVLTSALPFRSGDVKAKILEQVHGRLSIDQSSTAPMTSAVISALLNSSELEAGMRLLSRFPLLFASAPLSLYHTIVESHVLSERQKHEVNQILEIADTNAWASYKEATTARGALLPPQLSAALMIELGDLQPSLGTKQFTSWASAFTQYGAEAEANGEIQQAKQAQASYVETVENLPSRSFEYRNSGWGGEVQLHDSVCAMCELPVFIIAEGNSNLEVVLLPCGHAYHNRCLEEETCSACLDSNLETLDWL